MAHPRALLLGKIALVGYFLLALFWLTLRYQLLPQVAAYRGEIEHLLSERLHLTVQIGQINADLYGFYPRLDIRNLQLESAQGQTLLHFDRVSAEIAWSSLLLLDLRLHSLSIVAPVIDVRRDVKGQISIAGVALNAQSADHRFTDWLLAQGRVNVLDARLTWTDDLRHAPALTLTEVNTSLVNDGDTHQFALYAAPPREIADKVDVRTEFVRDTSYQPREETDAQSADVDLFDSINHLLARAGLSLQAKNFTMFGEFSAANFASWRPWLDLPLELSRGQGNLRLWLERTANKGAGDFGLAADFSLADAYFRLNKRLPSFDLKTLSGRLNLRRTGVLREAGLSNFSLSMRDGPQLPPTDLLIRRTAEGGALATRSLDLDALIRLTDWLPLTVAQRQWLAQQAPHGRFTNLEVSWQGKTAADGWLPEVLNAWQVHGEFSRLGMAAQGQRPGFANLSGTIEGDQDAGQLKLDSRQAALDLPAIFSEPHIALERFQGEARWLAGNGSVTVQIPQMTFRNGDAEGEAHGSLQLPQRTGADVTPGSNSIDLTAQLASADGTAVWRYLPLAVSEKVRTWVKDSVKSGRASRVTLKLRGELNKFPFKDGKGGLFEVRAKLRDAALDFADDWPQISAISGELLFSGAQMLITANSAQSQGVALDTVTAQIADLGAKDVLLQIKGHATGATADFLHYIQESPVAGYINHATDKMSARGDSQLDVQLELPLNHLADTRLSGTARLHDNELVAVPGLPPFTGIEGELRFTGNSLSMRHARGNWLGMALIADLSTLRDGSLQLALAGIADMRELASRLAQPLLGQLSGATPWRATVRAQKSRVSLRVESSLVGLASNLPVPLNKTAEQALPLVFTLRPVDSRHNESLLVLGDVLRANFLSRLGDTTPAVIERGAIGVGAWIPPPASGVALALAAPQINVDYWRGLLPKAAPPASPPSTLPQTPAPDTATHAESAAKPAGSDDFPLRRIEIDTRSLTGWGETLDSPRISASKNGEIWQARINSRQISGELTWDGRGNGHLGGHLAQVLIERKEKKDIASTTLAKSGGAWPTIDVQIDHCTVGERDLGAINLQAANLEGEWQSKFLLKNDDSVVRGNGRWRPASNITALDFKADVSNIERFLQRMGYVDAISRGSATVNASLSWNGSPSNPDIPSLTGKLDLRAEKGQFKKLEPGVGRLLGVLSLQSLPRRLTLDFRDIFSAGYAFDRIDAHADIAQGNLAIDKLTINSPAATVFMAGEVNLVNETQNLKVRVQPAISETVATGVLLFNPLTGAAAFAFNKLFGSPFDRAFAFDYMVTGSWADPKVEKVGVKPPTHTTEPAQ